MIRIILWYIDLIIGTGIIFICFSYYLRNKLALRNATIKSNFLIEITINYYKNTWLNVPWLIEILVKMNYRSNIFFRRHAKIRYYLLFSKEKRLSSNMFKQGPRKSNVYLKSGELKKITIQLTAVDLM